MRNKELTKDESLALIADMIEQAKRNAARGGSFHLLLWGWVVMLANIGHYFIAKYHWYEHPQVVWVLTIPAAVASIVYGAGKSDFLVFLEGLDTGGNYRNLLSLNTFHNHR